jgi:hypothetical protein
MADDNRKARKVVDEMRIDLLKLRDNTNALIEEITRNFENTKGRYKKSCEKYEARTASFNKHKAVYESKIKDLLKKLDEKEDGFRALRRIINGTAVQQSVVDLQPQPQTQPQTQPHVDSQVQPHAEPHVYPTVRKRTHDEREDNVIIIEDEPVIEQKPKKHLRFRPISQKNVVEV